MKGGLTAGDVETLTRLGLTPDSSRITKVVIVATPDGRRRKRAENTHTHTHTHTHARTNARTHAHPHTYILRWGARQVFNKQTKSRKKEKEGKRDSFIYVFLFLSRNIFCVNLLFSISMNTKMICLCEISLLINVLHLYFLLSPQTSLRLFIDPNKTPMRSFCSSSKLYCIVSFPVFCNKLLGRCLAFFPHIPHHLGLWIF